MIDDRWKHDGNSESSFGNLRLIGHVGDWLIVAGIKHVVHHGIIREDAADVAEVKLDVPLGTESIKGLFGSK